MSSQILFKKQYQVDLRDVDFTKRLKLSSLFTYFQDTANHAATSLGLGIEKLRNDGLTWILIRIRVEINRIPSLNEKITIETWPQPPSRLEFERDFLVKDENGNVLIKAISNWIIMDIHNRKLKRTESLGIHYPEVIEERALKDYPLKKLKDIENLEPVYEKVIGYSDIDINGHLNNSKYMDYIMDCYPVESHLLYDVKMIEVNFINEALPNEKIMLLKGMEESEIYINGINQNNKKVVFKSKVLIEKKNL